MQFAENKCAVKQGRLNRLSESSESSELFGFYFFARVRLIIFDKIK